MHVCIPVLLEFWRRPCLTANDRKMANFPLLRIPDPSPSGQTGFLLDVQRYTSLEFFPDYLSGLRDLFVHPLFRASPSVQKNIF